MIRLCTLAGTKKLGIDLHDPFVALVIHGGYMYFDVNNQVCGATSILAAPESPNDSLLQFSDGDCIDMDGSSYVHYRTVNSVAEGEGGKGGVMGVAAPLSNPVVGGT